MAETYNTLIDNSEHLKLVDFVTKILSDESITKVDIATGYWDIPGLALISKELQDFLQRKGAKLRILIGKDPYLYAKYNKNPKYGDAKQFPEDFIKADINEIGVKEEYVSVVAFFLNNLGQDEKFEVRIFKKNENDEVQFLHSKCWIFKTEKDADEEKAYGIVGSSNFTKNGLSKSKNLKTKTIQKNGHI